MDPKEVPLVITRLLELFSTIQWPQTRASVSDLLWPFLTDQQAESKQDGDLLIRIVSCPDSEWTAHKLDLAARWLLLAELFQLLGHPDPNLAAWNWWAEWRIKYSRPPLGEVLVDRLETITLGLARSKNLDWLFTQVSQLIGVSLRLAPGASLVAWLAKVMLLTPLPEGEKWPVNGRWPLVELLNFGTEYQSQAKALMNKVRSGEWQMDSDLDASAALKDLLAAYWQVTKFKKPASFWQ